GRVFVLGQPVLVRPGGVPRHQPVERRLVARMPLRVDGEGRTGLVCRHRVRRRAAGGLVTTSMRRACRPPHREHGSEIMSRIVWLVIEIVVGVLVAGVLVGGAVGAATAGGYPTAPWMIW